MVQKTKTSVTGKGSDKVVDTKTRCKNNGSPIDVYIKGRIVKELEGSVALVVHQEARKDTPRETMIPRNYLIRRTSSKELEAAAIGYAKEDTIDFSTKVNYTPFNPTHAGGHVVTIMAGVARLVLPKYKAGT